MDLGQLITSTKFFVDTSSLLHTKATMFFCNSLSKILSASEKKVIIPKAVITEINRLEKHKDSEKRKKAKCGTTIVQQYLDQNLVVIKGEKSDSFADNLFLHIFTKFRIKHNLTLLTQDVKLAKDIRDLMSIRSVDSSKSIYVLKIDKQGRCVPWKWDKPKNIIKSNIANRYEKDISVVPLVASVKNEKITFSPKKLAQKVLPAGVMVKTSKGHGSGFFCAPSGLVITNFHVIEGAGEIAVITASGKEFPVQKVIAGNRIDDVAVLSVYIPHNLKPKYLSLDDETISVGERLLVMGNPLGLQQTVSEGIVSSLRLAHKRIQITAPISPGSSGGPLLNAKGKVIGISVSSIIDNQAQNLNFAVPALVIKKYLPGTNTSWQISTEVKPIKTVIKTLAFSPDNRCIIAVDKDGLIYKVGLETSKLLRKTKKARNILDLTFTSPSTFYTTEYDKGKRHLIFQIWANGKPDKKLKFEYPVKPPVFAATWFQEYMALISKAKEDRWIISLLENKLSYASFDIEMLKEFHFKTKPVVVALSGAQKSDDISQLVLAVVMSNGQIVFIRCATGEKIRKIRSRHQICSLRFDPGGMGIIFGDKDGNMWEWIVFDILREKLKMHKIGAYKSKVNSIAFSLDGTKMASATSTGKIKVWASVRI